MREREREETALYFLFWRQLCIFCFESMSERERERERERDCMLTLSGPINILFLISQSAAEAGEKED